VIAKTLVREIDVLVITLVEVVEIADGVTVFSLVPDGRVTVDKDPIVMTFKDVDVVVWVSIGVDVRLKVTVGVKVVVMGDPTVRYKSLCHAKGCPSSPLLPRTRRSQ
jgi:hypothetical protein